jgi:SP family general alpha glucoside:H+ symporter-like MFS transporter
MADTEKAQAVQTEHDSVYNEKAGISDYKAGAIEAENAEHNLGVLASVRAYPMASFWAFVFSCLIVSCNSLRSRSMLRG